jgi:hypothetical protein
MNNSFILTIKEVNTHGGSSTPRWTFASDEDRDVFSHFSAGYGNIDEDRIPALRQAAELHGWHVLQLGRSTHGAETCAVTPPPATVSVLKGQLGGALESASRLMGSKRDEIHGVSRGDPDFVPPPEIQKAARDIDRWMKENGHKRWQLGDVCDRAFVFDLCEMEAKFSGLEGRSLGEIQRLRKKLGDLMIQGNACPAQESALKRDEEKIMKRSLEMMARPDRGPLTGYNTLGDKI